MEMFPTSPITYENAKKLWFTELKQNIKVTNLCCFCLKFLRCTRGLLFCCCNVPVSSCKTDFNGTGRKSAINE